MIEVNLAKTANDIEKCYQIRAEVFIVEQKVPVEIERDEYDATAFHFLAQSDGQAIGTARVVLKDGGKTAKIGRVAVRQSHRGAGVGKLLILAIEAAAELQQVEHFALEAQTHALSFYARLGYEAHGEEFMDAGIPHLSMKKPNARIASPG